MELIYQHWQYMWLFPHMFGFYHMCVVISTHNTVTISVVFTTEVCVFAHTCGNNHICVEKPNKQVLGFSHTGVEKHTQGLISPWANGVSLYDNSLSPWGNVPGTSCGNNRHSVMCWHQADGHWASIFVLSQDMSCPENILNTVSNSKF